jgi:lipopolysaccharide transport system ATP-binding protein
VRAGEAVGIMGVNGAGKSTLLKMISGTTIPTCGHVSVGGRVAALLELGMGFHPDFTGRQNVFMAGQLQGLPTRQIESLMPEIERFAEIGDYIDLPLRVYSSGMQVRLAFSVATAIRPDILIIDEALSVGDAYFQNKCYQRLAEYKSAGTTFVLVTHSVEDVVKHCDRVILLKDGRIHADGSAREVSNLYLDALFGATQASPPGHDLPDADVLVLETINQGDVFMQRPGYQKTEHRWGHGGAAIIDYKIVADGGEYPGRIESGVKTSFYFKVHFERDFNEVIPGFLIKSLDGVFLYGTNSCISSNRAERLCAHAGETCVYRFSLEINLNQGHYLLSFGISTGNPAAELLPLDRRYDSVIINVGCKQPFWGLIDLNAEFDCIGR